MKLVSCHIMNFGKLTDEKFDLDKDLVVLKEDNSFGKTTLANFIASMFYGLPSKQKKNISENERLKYEPWQGGVYGGKLVFSYNGKKYCVERDFNKKGDDFRLYDVETKRDVDKINGQVVDFSNLGDVLFGINKDSYKRSAYVPQDEIICSEIESGLNDRLRNLINATSENFSFDKSVDVLEKAEKSIMSPRGLGKLKDVLNRTNELNNKIDECKICADNSITYGEELKILQEQLKKCNKEIEEYDTRIKAQNESEKTLAEQKHFIEIKESIRQCESIIERLVPFFKDENIDSIDLNKIKDTIDKAERQRKVVQEINDETLQERSRLANIDTANASRQERKNLLNTQIQGLENEKKKYASEKIGIIQIILGILTLGLYFLLLKNKNKQNKEKIKEIENQITIIEQQLSEINNQSNQTDTGKLTEIKNKLETEESLQRQFAQNVENMLSKFDCRERDFISRFHEISGKYNEFVTAKKSLEENKVKFNKFVQGKDQSKLVSQVEITISVADLQAIRDEKDEQRVNLIKEIADLKTRIEKNDEKADDITLFETELILLNEKKDILETEQKHISKAILFLKTANDNMASQYLTPLKDTSKQMIQAYNLDKSIIDFDADSKVKIAEKGKDRELDYFSKGIRELVSLCMRFALIDLIFKNSTEKPCVILDDPFVNLDDKKINSAKTFIKNLSKKYQIIYLTCHDSRKIEN